MRLVINNVPIEIEIADNLESRAAGLSRRDHLNQGDGMLFVFPDNERRSFWMKDTWIPLSIAYIGDDGRILNIEDMIPMDLSHVYSDGPARFALEVNKGWFTKNGISPGQKVQGLESCVSGYSVSPLNESTIVRAVTANDMNSMIRPHGLVPVELFDLPIIPPPPDDSEETARELAEVMHRHENNIVPSSLQELCDKDPNRLFELYLDRKNASYNSGWYRRLKKDLIPIIMQLKNMYGRLRPYQLAAIYGVNFMPDELETAESRAYPSGHTIQAYVIGLTLASQFPEHEEALIKIAEMVAQSRIDAGVHFPSDIEFGREISILIAEKVINANFS